MNAVETSGLGKRYGGTWALRDCTLAIPAGHVVALAGPNGAGKSTLLHLTVGLAKQSTGAISVLGNAAGSLPALDRVAFMDQDAALYSGLSVADMLRMGRSMNRRWDQARARDRLAELDIPLTRRIGRLSGGQHAQVALTLALARRPDLLVLDEPMSSLDPLARHEFKSALMTAVAQDGLSVIFSSHIVSDLERVCDYLVVLAGGRVQVAGQTEDLLAGHHVLVGPTAQADQVAATLPVVRDRRATAQTHLLIRATGQTLATPPGWRKEPVGLEELVLAYLREPDAFALPGPRTSDATKEATFS
ncbi:ABC transporter ATP-binding protein [Microtetraspora glauca]|uniref:ABC transporter ATP-binding protein n=1 Tax=Microtetraspora glauca TaxID=1996 RepID=A0ABV3GUJ0_MICGL